MTDLAAKLRNERRRHQKLRLAVRIFLYDFKTGTHDQWQESLGKLRMLTERRRVDSTAERKP